MLACEPQAHNLLDKILRRPGMFALLALWLHRVVEVSIVEMLIDPTACSFHIVVIF